MVLRVLGRLGNSCLKRRDRLDELFLPHVDLTYYEVGDGIVGLERDERLSRC